MEGLLEAKRLRKRIEQLQHYRRVGIRTIAEASLYESERERQHGSARLRLDALERAARQREQLVDGVGRAAPLSRERGTSARG